MEQIVLPRGRRHHHQRVVAQQPREVGGDVVALERQNVTVAQQLAAAHGVAHVRPTRGAWRTGRGAPARLDPARPPLHHRAELDVHVVCVKVREPVHKRPAQPVARCAAAPHEGVTLARPRHEALRAHTRRRVVQVHLPRHEHSVRAVGAD